MISIFKAPEPKKEITLGESCSTLFENLNVYLWEVCGNNCEEDPNSKSKATTNNGGLFNNHEQDSTRKNREYEKRKREISEDIQRIAQGCQETVNNVAKHLNEDVQRLNKNLERAIDDEKRKH